MANEEHLTRLLQGAEAWNAWRESEPEVQPDLEGMDLSHLDIARVNLQHARLSSATLTSVSLAGADLRAISANGIQLDQVNLAHADLSGANMRYSDFTDVDFTGATLNAAWLLDCWFMRVKMSDADLTGVDLTLASLPQADLSGANMSSAILYETDLRETKLYRTNFTSAFFTKTNMTGASMAWTLLANVDLRLVEGLETVQHDGPSTIGIDTLYRSQGDISEQFLHAIGAPVSFAEWMRSHTGFARRRSSCILMSAGIDRVFAEHLHRDLRRYDIDCWLAPDAWTISDTHSHHLDPVIHFYERLLLVVSERSMSQRWIKQAIQQARIREGYEGDASPVVLFPICLDQVAMTNTQLWGSQQREIPHLTFFEHWHSPSVYQHALNQLLLHMKASQE